MIDQRYKNTYKEVNTRQEHVREKVVGSNPGAG